MESIKEKIKYYYQDEDITCEMNLYEPYLHILNTCDECNRYIFCSALFDAIGQGKNHNRAQQRTFFYILIDAVYSDATLSFEDYFGSQKAISFAFFKY